MAARISASTSPAPRLVLFVTWMATYTLVFASGRGGVAPPPALDPPLRSAVMDLSICDLTEGADSRFNALSRQGRPAGFPSFPSAAAAATLTDALLSPSASQSGLTAALSPEAPSASAACVRTR